MDWKTLFCRKVLATALILVIPLHLVAMELHLINVDSGKISIKANGITVKEVLSQIEQNSSYRFLFDDELPELNNKIDVNVKNQDVGLFLQSVLS